MNSLLDNQKIRKRKFYGQSENRKAGKLSRKGHSPKTAFRPAGVSSLFEQNSRFIDKMKQHPSHLHERKVAALHAQIRHENLPRKSHSTKRSLAFPAVPLFFLAVMGLFYIINNHGLDWIGREAVAVESDPGGRYNLALYAGVNQSERQEAGTADSNPADANVANANPANSNVANTNSAGNNTAGGNSARVNPAGENSAGLIPLDLTEVFAWQSYKVKRGDSVSKIAADFSVSMDAIIASNGISNARSLREGETLRIPNMDGIPYTVKSGDSLSKISQSMGVPLEAILDANELQSDVITAGTTLFIPGARMNKEELKLALGELFIYPIRGSRLSSPFGWRNDPFTGVRRHHAAVDLSAPQGTVVRAAMDGTVSMQSYDVTYGNFIIITHSGGYQTMYAHLYSASVKKGDKVAQGNQIGLVGNTGYSTGPHLHFAIFKNSRAVNPLDYISGQR